MKLSDLLGMFGGGGGEMPELPEHILKMIANMTGQDPVEIKQQYEEFKTMMSGGEFESLGVLEDEECKLYSELVEAKDEAKKSIAKLENLKLILHGKIRLRLELSDRDMKIDPKTGEILAQKKSEEK